MIPDNLRQEAEAHLKNKGVFPGEMTKLRASLESGNVILLELVLRGIRLRREAQAREAREQKAREAKKKKRIERMVERERNAREMNEAIKANLAELENDPK